MVLGSLVYFIGQALFPSSERHPEPVVISAAEIAAARRDWRRSVGRDPTASELDRLVEERVDEELLFRAALALGLQHGDAVIERRLIANQRFLEGEAREPGRLRSDEALLREAYELELERTDLIVRRRLLERIRQRIVTAARTRDALEASDPAGSADEKPRANAPARVRLTHLFLSRDARGDRLTADAEALHEKVVTLSLTPRQALDLGLGDPLAISPELPLSSQRELALRLGAGFAERSFDQPLERWSEPIASSYGLHLVWIRERVEPAAPSTDEPPRVREPEHVAAADRRALRDALSQLRLGTRVIREDDGPAATE